MGFGRALREARTISSVPWGSTRDPWGAWPGDEYGPTASGAVVNSQTATQLLTVYGCVQLIAHQVAMLPIDAYRETANGPQEVRTPDWLVMPAPDLDLDWISFVTQLISSLLLDGEAFVARLSDSAGRTTALVPLAPCDMDIKLVAGRRVVFHKGVPAPWDVIYIPAIMRAGSLRGMSPIEAARQTIGLGMSALEFGARFFGQGATMAGVISVPTQLPPDGPGSPRELAKAFMRQHSGKNRAHLPAVLQGGAQWQSTGVTQEQAQFLETRQFTDAQIAAQLFMLDPADLGISVPGSTLTYINQEQRDIRRVRMAIMPWVVRIEKALSALLARPQYVKINLDALMRADTKSRFEAYAIGITNEFIVPNEARAWEELAPLPGGDEVVTPPAPIPPAAAGGNTEVPT